jgi:hypothetical protein
MNIHRMMTNDLEGKKKQLQEKYAFLHHPQSKVLMERGIECDNGWLPLLEDLFLRMENIVKKQNLINFWVVQIKEKLGDLRVYCENASSEMDNLIREYEEKSLETCELCGKPGKRNNFHGLLKITCSNCRKEKQWN